MSMAARPSLPLRRNNVLGRFGAVHPDFHLNARPEPVDDGHEAIDSESPEVCIANAREVGRRNAGAIVRGAHGQVILVESLDNLGSQDGLELFGIGVFVAQIAEYIAAPPHHFQLWSARQDRSSLVLSYVTTLVKKARRHATSKFLGCRSVFQYH